MTNLDQIGEGRVAIVTGGASGLGLAMVERFAASRFSIGLLDIDHEAAEAVASRLRAQGTEVLPLTTDVAEPRQVEASFQRVLERWDRVDVVVNNAGILGRAGKIEDLDEDNLERVFAVDLVAPFYVSKQAVLAQRTRGGGSIINIASITAATGSAYYPAYSAAKAGVIALTQSIARNAGRYRIRVNCINPGSVLGTELTQTSHGRPPTLEEQRDEKIGLLAKIPLARVGRPQDIANLALFLASPLAEHIHGAVLTIDGGEMLTFH